MSAVRHQIPPPDRVWDEVEAGLSRDPSESLNIAVEACGRHVTSSRQPVLIVRHADGSADRWTYADLDQLATRAARMFANAGLRRGDRVATVLSRRVESWIVALAAWRSGLVHVPLFAGFGADALAFRLATSEARLVVVTPEVVDGGVSS